MKYQMNIKSIHTVCSVNCFTMAFVFRFQREACSSSDPTSMRELNKNYKHIYTTHIVQVLFVELTHRVKSDRHEEPRHSDGKILHISQFSKSVIVVMVSEMGIEDGFLRSYPPQCKD